MTRPVHVALLHAYSARNSGDGLLVELSVALLRDAFGADTQVSIVAADPASFPGHPDVRPAPVLAAGGAGRLIGAAMAALPVGANPALADLRTLLRRADLIVGVGGGYLRARNAVEALKLEAGHLVQMRAARAARKPTVYLSQSIGPATGNPLLAGHLTSLLAGFDAVFARDDRSVAFLAANANTRRAPDLAVLEFGHRAAGLFDRVRSAAPTPAHVALVLRRPPAWNDAQRARYLASTDALIERLSPLCRVTFAVQSAGRGNDDAAYYRERGFDAPRSLKDVLANDTPDAVVSVRLHGALEAILHGVPAYHLSYERKGFGAYADLGVDNWVANAADFDANAVCDTLLAPNALSRFWLRAEAGLARLDSEREHIVAALRDALANGAAR
ncbi:MULTISPECIES: polysaccharide pyruvyl transferase family protein [Burkholderia cepacia complex]|uniref:polysaccharide pyruvyl transferase family protein n=1 Tax=Burkholderia cepacia complex TaxID=87882 RepID=UPI00098F9E9D|nr:MULTISPECIES: polysaccharide pyruvyl transferase family protein [Burkholderia cepacia complex]AQT51982.1 polysaccharide pyruvyl transferase [Burkholderia cenocepacia]MDN7533400.1 polysaccharide pyruvyl transferase family protein [Burkholderia orbicola]